MNINILDILLSVVILFFGFIGFKKGFAKQLSTFLTFLLTVLLIYYVYQFFLEFLANTFPALDKNATLGIGVITLILLSIGLFVIINQILSTGIASNLSENTNKWLGSLFGMFRGILLLIIIITIAIHVNEKSVGKWLESKSIAGKWFSKSFYKEIKKHIDKDNIEEKIKNLNERVEWPDPVEIINQ